MGMEGSYVCPKKETHVGIEEHEDVISKYRPGREDEDVGIYMMTGPKLIL